MRRRAARHSSLRQALPWSIGLLLLLVTRLQAHSSTSALTPSRLDTLPRLRGGGYAYQKPGSNKLAPRHTPGQLHAHEVPGHYALEVHPNFDLEQQTWVGGTVEDPKAFWGKAGAPPLPEAVPELIELALGSRINAPINEEVALTWVKMTDQRLQATLQEEEAEEEQLPLVCDTCLGPNPYVKMNKYPEDGECKICSETFSWFRWKPDTIDVRIKVRWKKTIICTPCAKAKDVCQACLFDLKLSLSVGIRDTLLEKGKSAFLPESMQKLLPEPPTGDDGTAQHTGASNHLKLLNRDAATRTTDWNMQTLPAPDGEGAASDQGSENGEQSAEDDEGVRPELHAMGGPAPLQHRGGQPLSIGGGDGLAVSGRSSAASPQRHGGDVARSPALSEGRSVPLPPMKPSGAIEDDGERRVVVPAPAGGATVAEWNPQDVAMHPTHRAKAELTAALLAGRTGWQRQYQQNRAKICSFWIAGECSRGVSCEFRHEKPTFYEARDMGLIQGMKGTNTDMSIIQRYYGDPKDEVAKSVLRDINRRSPNLLKKANWPKQHAAIEGGGQRAIKGGGGSRRLGPRLAGEFEAGKPATMVACWDAASAAPSREAIRGLFEQHGEILSVRTVAHKGIAYVKYKELCGAHGAYKAIGKGCSLGALKISCSPHLPS